MKKISKIAVVVLVLCLVFFALALSGCGEQGEQGIQGEKGETGTVWLNGASDPSEDLGRVGDYYLNTTTYDVYQKSESGWGEAIINIKGAPGVDATACEHTYGDITVVIEQTGLTDGFGFKTCSTCGNQQMVVLEKIAGIDPRNPIMLELDSNGKCVVENTGSTIYVAFLATQSGRVQVSLTSIGTYSYDITSNYLNAFYKNTYNDVEKNETRVYDQGELVIVKVNVNSYYTQFELAASYVDSNAQYNHTFSVQGTNYANVTAVQVVGESAYYGEYTVAEGTLVDGEVTLSFVPGIYEIKLVGLDEENYQMSDNSSSLTTQLPVDGSNDEGSNYTYYFLGTYNYTVTVTRDGSPVDGALVGVHNAVSFTSEGVPSSYKTEASKTVTTDENGSATLVLTDAIYNVLGNSTIGLYYAARLDVSSLGYAECAADVVIDPSANTINIEITPASVSTLSSTDTTLTFYSYGKNTSMAYATATVDADGAYSISLSNAFNYASYTIFVDGVEVGTIATDKDVNYGSVTITLTEGTHNVSIKTNSVATNLNNKGLLANIVATTVTNEVVGTQLYLGESTIYEDGMYTFIAETAGSYTFTDLSIQTVSDSFGDEIIACFAMAENKAKYDDFDFIWDSYDTESYTVELQEGEYFVFYLVFYEDADGEYPVLEISFEEA